MSAPSPHPPRTWLLHSRTFRLGLLVTAFFAWLTIDSFRYLSICRTTHGAVSRLSTMARGKPDARAFVISASGGSLGLVWYDRFPPLLSYEVERVRTPADVKTLWRPQIVAQRGSSFDVHGASVPTWLILVVWLTIWTWLLVKARQRRRAYLVRAS